MSQLWTIVDIATGDVLYDAFRTPSFGAHPKHHGWDWDAETQRAARIDGEPDRLRQSFDGAAWVDDLDKLRALKWSAVRMARDRAEWGGCPTPLGRVDTDPDSQRKVSGSVQLAMIAQAAGVPFQIAWTMQDNSTVIHDAPAMIAMGVAVGQHVASCHAEALSRRTTIEKSGEVGDIESVAVDGGWPGASG